jgi:hypothetical protein
MRKFVLTLALVAMVSAPALADIVQSESITGFNGNVALSASPRGNMVYDCRNAATAAYSKPLGTGVGEDVTLAGTDRWLDSIYFSVWNYTGQATLTSVRDTFTFWADYTMATSLGSFYFDLTAMNLPGGYYTTYSATGLYAAGVRIQLTDVPMWTSTFSNASPAVAQVGMVLAGTPTLGSSTNDFWNGTAWSWFGSTGPLANFYFGLDAVPEPATLALLAVGALALIRRR